MSENKGNLLQAIILESEKAAKIARAIRQEDHLLSLLVREKKNDEKNPRFLHDFKTLADVLIQEVVKHDLGTKFPGLRGYIFGEESNEFSCLDGETLCLKVDNTEEHTRSQLIRVLGNERAAKTLSELVHSVPSLENLNIPEFDTTANELGVWIDPIDSTAEYITGGAVESSVEGVFSSGLPCVTVLIGAFNRNSGQPVLGVINQPFYQLVGNRWTGNVVWGLDHENSTAYSIPKTISTSKINKVVLLSSSESSEVTSSLIAEGFTLVNVAGAGYKLVCVALGLVSAYVLSKPSTFYWDTCAPHAVLRSVGGGMVDYAEAVRGYTTPITYMGGVGTEHCCNKGGFIAYRDENTMIKIVSLLKN